MLLGLRARLTLLITAFTAGVVLLGMAAVTWQDRWLHVRGLHLLLERDLDRAEEELITGSSVTPPVPAANEVAEFRSRWMCLEATDGSCLGTFPTITELPPADELIVRHRLVSGRQGTVQISAKAHVAKLNEHLWDRVVVLGWTSLACLPLIAIGAWFIAARVQRPLQDLLLAIRDISARKLTARLPEQGPEDELLALRREVNRLFARLEQSFTSLEAFTADVAHEIKSSLAAMRAVGETSIDQSPARTRAAVGSLLEECSELQELVDQLLLLARAENRQLPVTTIPVHSDQLARQVYHLLEVVAEESQHRLVIGKLDAHRLVDIDVPLMNRAVFNLVMNAIRHTPPDTTISLSTGDEGEWVVITVQDDGPGMAPELISRLGARFLRGRPADLRGPDAGFGLGLSIALRLTELHHGTLQIDAPPQGGCRCRIRLPARSGPISSDRLRALSAHIGTHSI